MAKKQKTEKQKESKPVETPEQRFTRLAIPRVQTALKRISLIGNLASSSYRYTPEQADKIVSALQDAVNTVKAKFKKEKTEQSTFTL